MRNFVQKIKTHILCSASCAVREAVWKNTVVPDNMAHAHCMLDTQAYKHTLGIRNRMLIAFPPQQRLHERASMLRLYVH